MGKLNPENKTAGACSCSCSLLGLGYRVECICFLRSQINEYDFLFIFYFFGLNFIAIFKLSILSSESVKCSQVRVFSLTSYLRIGY